MTVRAWSLGLLSCVGFCSTVLAGDWPGFRGPTGSGIADAAAKPPLTWSRDENIAWKLPLDAPGNSSPIIIGDKVYGIVANRRGTLYSLICLDRQSGKEHWRTSVDDDTPEPTHGTNPYGAATPAADAQRVVVWYGDAGLHAYSHAGEKLWSVATPNVRHIWGYGSSPVLSEGKVFLNTGVGPEAAMLAIDAATGDELWRTPEPGGEAGTDNKGGWIGSWSTPVLTHIGDRQQLLCAQPTRVVAYHPESGDILWYCEGLANLPRGNLAYTSLLIGQEHAIAMGGYNGPAMGFRLGGSGNVTATHQLWRDAMNNPQRIGSGVVVGDAVFMANAGPGIIECLELATGKEHWKTRPEAGGNFWGSMVLADSRIYVTNQEGTTIVMAAESAAFRQLAENRLDEHCNTTPAIADGDLILRTDAHIYCIREPAQ